MAPAIINCASSENVAVHERERKRWHSLEPAAALFMKSAKCEIKYLMLQYAERNNAES
jgi:hypothetical protein